MKLEICNVSKTFREKTAVNVFSMELQAGECVGLIGPNGAGKSTLIKMIANVMNTDQGEVRLGGQSISHMKREIGYLPQYPNFFSWMSAEETLRFMGKLSGIGEAALVKEIPAILEKVGLERESRSKVSTFSGGMKQRLGIAQALLHKPAFVIMDEPVSALDPIGRREVLNLLQEIKKETTILLSTHILNDAQEICERFVIMKQGEKIADTTIAELLSQDTEQAVRLEITPKDLPWVEEVVRKLPYVLDVEAIGNRVKIKMEQIHQNKADLLQRALEHDVDLIRFEAEGKDALEDIFLKMVVGA